MKRYNVMIFPAGSEIGLEINRALRDSKFVTIFGVASVSDHSEFVYENLITGLPFIGEDGFVEKLNESIKAHDIDYIYPAYDAAQVYLMEHQNEIDATIVSAPYETVATLRSKKKTYEALGDASFVPTTWRNPQDVTEFPVFVKPTESQGSQGARRVDTMEELVAAVDADPTIVICEYLSGDECTVDCFTDRNGKLLAVNPRSRDRIRTGIAVRSTNMEATEEIRLIAETINKNFTFTGAWFFQLKKGASGAYKLLEASPRIPGTCGVTRNTGVNYPMLTLFTMWGFDVSLAQNDYTITVDRAFYSAYKIDIDYDTVYLDFDDTLIVDGQVNLRCIQFVYQALNAGKRMVLLTKHDTDIYDDLAKWHIDKTIFDEIHHMDKSEEKFTYITDKKAIFIDDSFGERIKIKENTGIPVFDVDMIEALIDHRK